MQIELVEKIGEKDASIGPMFVNSDVVTNYVTTRGNIINYNNNYYKVLSSMYIDKTGTFTVYVSDLNKKSTD